MNAPRLPVVPLLLTLTLLSACPEEEAAYGPLVDGGRLNVVVLVDDDGGDHIGLNAAAEDLRTTLLATLGATELAADPKYRVYLEVADNLTDRLGPEGYVFTPAEDASITITGATPVGAMYGAYHMAQLLGARWYHPEEQAFVPYTGDALPIVEGDQKPSFERRGFHHHTQHPIIASDVLLRPGDAAFREYASKLIRYQARNRSNTLSWHMLKTMDLDSWAPYMADIAAEAADYGVQVGCVTSFADQQQNNFKLIQDPNQPADAQITSNLDTILDAGLSFIAFQIGTSEFTKPEDAEVISWMNTAVAHVRDAHPGVRTYAWIHITCDLEDDNGGHFYHLPLQADEDLGAWVHTTMFYSMGRPAPVYGCQNFDHQFEFIEAASASGREQIWFPESAWWLGFDNNMPLALPLTGLSREEDIVRFAPQMTGHITFTTGREWTYWQYDHYLTQATWDATLSWDAYLDWIAPVYGDRSADVATALKAWTDLQEQHIYEETPLIYFYLAGELPQDELGEAAGILARRPKLSFQKVLNFTDQELTDWQATDMAQLLAMKAAYNPVFDALPVPSGDDGLYAELHRVLSIYVQRIDHAIALYEGVVAARAGDRTTADARLATAKAITADVLTVIATAEGYYRYPAELLTEEKPESLTSYPFGYLWETSTGFFWTRRDDQLALVIQQVFEGVAEEWQKTPDTLLISQAEDVTVVAPTSDLASTLLSGFVPQVLFGMSDWDAATGTLSFTIAQDQNTNLLPDPGTELTLSGAAGADAWSQTASAYPIGVYQTSGEKLSDLVVLNPEFRITPASGLPNSPEAIELIGQVQSQALIELVIAIAGIDPEGIGELIKGVWEIPPEDPLPELLDFHLSFAPKPAP